MNVSIDFVNEVVNNLHIDDLYVDGGVDIIFEGVSGSPLVFSLGELTDTVNIVVDEWDTITDGDVIQVVKNELHHKLTGIIEVVESEVNEAFGV